MPFPDIHGEYKGKVMINGVECYQFVHIDFDTKVDIYLSAKNNAPVRLTQESIENGITVPLLTYDYSNVVMGPLSDHIFEIPKPFIHDTCGWHVGGFPYLHIFHYFVRF